jgi:hypothetical protein
MTSLGPPGTPPLTLDALSPLEAGEIIFSVHGKDGPVEVLRFKDNGDIFVQGRLAENDKEVVEGIRIFLKAPAPKPEGGGRVRFERILDDDGS